MARIDLKHVHTFRDRHGKLRAYARVPGQEAVPLPGIPGSAEYMSAYQDAIAKAVPRPIGASRTIRAPSMPPSSPTTRTPRFWRCVLRRGIPAR